VILMIFAKKYRKIIAHEPPKTRVLHYVIMALLYDLDLSTYIYLKSAL
jgi:hypothetical protein